MASQSNHHPEGVSLKDLVARVPLFRELNDDELSEVVARVRPRHYSRGESLYQAGDSNSSLMILHSGKVKVYRILESGHEQLIRVLGPGEFLGGTSFLSGTPVDHFAATTEDAEICTFHHDDIRNYLLQHPSVAFTMLETLSQRLDETEQQLSSLVGDDAERRVADYLLGLMRAAGTRQFTLPIAKKDIASYLGLTPETLSRRLAQFESRGWISQLPRRVIEVREPDELGAL